MILKIICCLYVVCLIGSHLGIATTGFIRPKGLWNLVPFRVGGWESIMKDGKIYKLKWFFQDTDWDNFYFKNK